MVLNNDQENIRSLALKGHNLFIDGFAGTGKTFLLKSIITGLKNLGKNVALTCTTGIACMNFEQSFNPSTIHRWSGLHDGRYNSTEILSLVANNEEALHRIKSKDTLIIDEISMFSCKLFDQLHSICCLKDGNKPWGGIQIIVSGDFNQLPPTPNRNYNDDGVFCFKSDYFKSLHHVTLNTVVRQSDRPFIEVIRRVSTGMNISEEIVNYMKTLERPLHEENSLKLFARNDLVSAYNRKLLINQPGEIYEYKATDTGDRSKLQNVTAQVILWLKENCPVVLIRNISSTLVNGLQGTVIKCEADGPTVHFPAISSTVKVKKISFSVFSPRQNRTIANREHIPLLLSYALTIHKAQGMTLDSVEVDCREIFQPGQLGVAIGRVRSAERLRVINFNPKVCLPQPREIRLFNDEPPLVVLDDLSCCRICDRVDKADASDFWTEDDSVFFNEPEEDFDDEFNEVLSRLDLCDSAESIEILENFDIRKVLQECITDDPVTPIQIEVNRMTRDILEGDLYNAQTFCKQQFLEYSKIVNDMGVSENVAVKPEKLNEFYTECHKYLTSDNYKLACMIFLQKYTPTSPGHSHICRTLSKSVRQHLLEEKAEIYKVSEREIAYRKVTDASKARIRYVGGYCIHQLKKKYSTLHRSVMYSCSSDGQTALQMAEECTSILNTFIEREDILRETTTDPQSLIDTDRRQYFSRGLLNITDDMYKFFCEACNLSIQYLIDKNLNVYGEQLHSFCLKEILNDMTLFESFVGITGKNLIHFDDLSTTVLLQSSESVVSCVMNETISNVQHATDLYTEVIQQFLLVMFSQFRKDLLDSFSVVKTMAHRKQIQTKKKKLALATKSVSFPTLLDDKTSRKEMSHSLLKGMLLSNSDVAAVMNKKQIALICKAYNISIKSADKKSDLAEKVKTAIVNST